MNRITPAIAAAPLVSEGSTMGQTPEWKLCLLIFAISVTSMSMVAFLLMIQGKLSAISS
jgi:hypothetical protein